MQANPAKAPSPNPEVTLLIRRRQHPSAQRPQQQQSKSARFQIEVPTDLLDEFGLCPAGGSKVIHCMRAA